MSALRAGRLPVLIGSVVAVAAICYVGAALATLGSPLPSSTQVGACVVLLYLGVRLHLPIRVGAQRVELSWAEAAIMLSLAIGLGAAVVLVMPIASGIYFVQRQIAAVKVLYNVSAYTVAATVAAMVVTVAGASPPLGRSGLIALALAGTLSGLVTYLAVAVVIAAVQDVPLLATWQVSAGLQALTLGGNLGLAVGVLVLARTEPGLLIALPVIALCLHIGYLGRLRGYQDRVAERRHTTAMERLAADLDEQEALRRVAEEACRLVDADAVDVELAAHGASPAILYRHHRTATPWSGEPAAAPPLPARAVTTLPIPISDDLEAGCLRVWLASNWPSLRLEQGAATALRSLAVQAGAAVANARAKARTHDATHDPLTHLPARQLLVERVERPLRAGVSGAWEPVALLVIDITGYREIIRALGHDVAELLLVRTAERLRAAAAEGEFVAYVGGDDFGVYLPAAGSPAHVRDRALALLAAVGEPVDLDVGQVAISAAAGAAYAATPIGSGAELLRQASVALDQARAARIPVDFYDPARDELGGPTAVVMASELHAALDEDQLDLHFQPIVHLPSGAPLAMEALARWMHPTKGMLYPSDFMSVLEHSRDHARFVDWQLARALATRAAWGESIPVTVNLAARCLLDQRFPAKVESALQRAGVPGHQLMLEIAETSALTEVGLVGDVLVRLRELGVQIAIDNLGRGTSSLINLLRVPATHVKVDAQFVQRMLVDDEAHAVVCLAFDLGRRADLHVVAVGVSREEHVVALLQLGCDRAQGRYFARPMLAGQVRTYLDSAPPLPSAPADVVVRLDTRRRTPST